MSHEPLHVRSRDNALLSTIRKLARDPAGYRKLGVVWLEGDHLCRALVDRGGHAREAVITESAWQQPSLRALAQTAGRVAIVPDALFAFSSGLESPARIGFVVACGPDLEPQRGIASVVLDRVQDPGNAGSILRSAAAFGFTQVLAIEGTAALWSPKVLRAGMGAHFALSLVERCDEGHLRSLSVPLVAASPRAPIELSRAVLPDPCAWVFAHEGKGIAPALLEQCDIAVRIEQPGGEESLNVAAAAAICLYETLRKRAMDLQCSVVRPPLAP